MNTQHNFKKGDWVLKKAGNVASVGYVKNMSNVPTAGGIRAHVIIVGFIKGSYIEMTSPKEYPVAPAALTLVYDTEYATDVFDKFQDFSALFDLALATNDEAWFKQLLKRSSKRKKEGNYETA